MIIHLLGLIQRQLNVETSEVAQKLIQDYIKKYQCLLYILRHSSISQENDWYEYMKI